MKPDGPVFGYGLRRFEEARPEALREECVGIPPAWF